MFPASVVSTDVNYQHIQNVIHYQRSAIENLKANLVSYQLMERQPLPNKSGKIQRFYMYNLMAPNTTPASEGTPGAPRSGGTIANTVEVQQYADYMTFSDLVIETAFSNMVDEGAVELGYSAGRSVDTLNYNQWEAAADADAASNIDLPAPEVMSAAVARRAKFSLQAANVKPKDGGLFGGVMHPLMSFDFANDNVAGGTLDILKYNDFSAIRRGVFASAEDSFTLDGIRWRLSSEVPTTENYDGTSETAYHAYVVGKNAFFATSLDFTKVPKERNFKPRVINYPPGSQLSDPAGLIRSAVAYNFKYATYVPPDGNSRFRRIRALVSIT